MEKKPRSHITFFHPCPNGQKNLILSSPEPPNLSCEYPKRRNLTRTNAFILVRIQKRSNIGFQTLLWGTRRAHNAPDLDNQADFPLSFPSTCLWNQRWQCEWHLILDYQQIMPCVWISANGAEISYGLPGRVLFSLISLLLLVSFPFIRRCFNV